MKATILNSECPVLTVIVPVYNESRTIAQILHRIDVVPISKQVIVVDDGSTDGTAIVLSAWQNHPRIELYRHQENRGKGSAIRTALAAARGKYAIVQDADLEYDPMDYLPILAHLEAGSCQVVLGSRYLAPGKTKIPTLFCLGVWVLNGFARLLFHIKLTDEATCYKAARTDVFKRMQLKCERFEFCPEFIAKACRLSLVIQEIPISYSPRNASAGKKIRLRDGWRAILTLWRWRNWRPKNQKESCDFVAGDRSLVC